MMEGGEEGAKEIRDKCTDKIFVMHLQIQLRKNQPGHFPDGKIKTARQF